MEVSPSGDILQYSDVQVTGKDLDDLVAASDALVKAEAMRREAIRYTRGGQESIRVRCDGAMDFGCQHVSAKNVRRVHALSRAMRGLK